MLLLKLAPRSHNNPWSIGDQSVVREYLLHRYLEATIIASLYPFRGYPPIAPPLLFEKIVLPDIGIPLLDAFDLGTLHPLLVYLVVGQILIIYPRYFIFVPVPGEIVE